MKKCEPPQSCFYVLILKHYILDIGDCDSGLERFASGDTVYLYVCVLSHIRCLGPVETSKQ